MVNSRISVEVKPGDGIAEFWVAIDDKDVTLTNGKGAANVNADANGHTLVWWMRGNSEASMSFKLSSGDKTILEIKKAAIPKNRRRGAGHRHFDL